MDQVVKGIQGRIQSLPASDHSIPAAPVMDSIRDAHVEETETTLSITPPPTVTDSNILTDSSTTQNAASNATTTTSIDDSNTPELHHAWLHHTSPKYTSPPIGSGGKYMIMSKRASWIDANACDSLESASSSPSCLPDRQVPKQRPPSIPDGSRTVLDNNNNSGNMHKSGSLSLLRGSRQSTLEQLTTTGSPSSPVSATAPSFSSSSSPPTALTSAPRSRQKALHITTSSLYSILTDTASPLEEDNGSTGSATSPLHIAQDKNKSIHLHHGHSPGSSFPLSGEAASASNLRTSNSNSKRRSSMSQLKNIPSAELANMVNGYTGSKSGDTTASIMANDVSRIKQNTRINSTMHFSSPSSPPPSISLSPSTASNRSTSISHSSSSNSSNSNGIPAYQQSLHSLLKRQLSAPKTSSSGIDSTISTPPLEANDTDVVAISLSSDEPSQTSTRPLVGNAQSFSSTVYPALLLGGLGQETDTTELPTSSRNPSLYINTSDLPHTSAPELHHLEGSMGYFDLPVVEEGVGIRTPLSAPGSRTLPITTTHATYLYQSRLRKISKWCIFNWDDSKAPVFIWVRQQLNSRKPFKLLAKIPASEMTHDMDLVNCIPWTDWIDEHRKPPTASIPGYSSSISATALAHDDVYPYHPLDTSFPSGTVASSISTDSDSMLPMLPSRRISATSSSSYLPGRSSTSYPPPPDHIGSVGFSFHGSGNRMGAFGRIGGGISTLLDDSGHSSPVSTSRHIPHTIRSRLQAAKNACNNEIRMIMDGLNEYVERGLRYVECFEQDLEQDGPSDESDDHDDPCYVSLLDQQESAYHPLQSVSVKPLQQGPLSNEQLSLSSFSPPANNSTNTPVRRRSLAIRLQNIEEQTEQSSSETDQSQVTTPSDERLPKQMMMKLLPHQTVNHPSPHASPLVPQECPADLKTSKAPSPSRYTMISEDAYLPTPFILTLQRLITLAQTVLDNSLEVYLENVGGCAAIVSRIQSVGTQWDAYPQWPCREWYVRLLLCVAAFNRVVEWWETERGFWYSRQGSDKSGTIPSRTRTGGPDTEDTDSLPRYRSASETESAWSYMEQQEDTLSKTGSPYLADVDCSDNNSFGGDYDQHHDSGSGNINGGSMMLQEAVKRGQSNTIVMELTLETTVVQYVSPVWRELIGLDAQDIIGKDISDLMVPEDRRVVSIATRGLLQDTLRTVEVQFSVRPDESTVIGMEGKGMLMYNRVTGQPSHTMWVIKPLSHHHTTSSSFIKRLSRCSSASTFQEPTSLNEDTSCNDFQKMHLGTTGGNGDDGDDDGDSDDMIVCPASNDIDKLRTLRLRSISEPAAIDTIVLGGLPNPNNNNGISNQHAQEAEAPISSATLMRRAISHGGIPTSDNPLLSPAALLSLPPVLCRVCERLVVAAFFEQHSELCVEMHRTEMDVIICNDSLQELKHLVQELADKSLSQSAMDGGAIDSKLSCLESGFNIGSDGVGDSTLYGASDSLSGLPLEGVADKNEEHRAETVAMCKELLEILDAAISIPIPESHSGGDGMEGALCGDAHQVAMVSQVKSKMTQILYWRPPPVDDAAFLPLTQDVGNLTKGKVDSVNRMQDRLEYNERVRLDFQQNMQQEKGWTEYVDDDMGGDQSSPDSDAFATSQLTLKDNTISYAATPTTTTSDSKRLPRKTFLGRFRNWHSKRSKRFTKGKRRKSHSIKVPPNIVEMETIDTPLASPNIHEKMAGSRASSATATVTTATKQPLSQQPSVPTSATSTTSSSTNTSVHRSSAPTIKDYDIIKPISKGAFGSVFLAKKRLTGDYYAIKFLKKSDMIAKNQVTNVKAERMILMTQTDSPFVTKLYYTFQSKDYLYLVLEYLNGGDCSALIKVLGRLPEDWARNYLAEVTLGLAYLYNKNIIHRDLKPDNLLIDQNGHLKLTDFGLSRIGFLDRRVRDELSYEPYSSAPLPTSPAPSRSNTPPLPSSPTVSCNTSLSPTFSNLYKHSYFSALFERDRQRRGSHASSSSSCGGGGGIDLNTTNDYSPRVNYQHYHQQPYVSSYSSSAASTPGWMDDRTSFSWTRSSGIQIGKSPFMGYGKASETTNGDSSSTTKRQAQHDFRAIGTPDYIAPESILGTGHDSMVDWWALGVICYEFLYGYPPFNDDSPDKVFENILSRRIDWHGNEIDVSADARDFMEKLMTLDPTKRLGAGGPEEVKQHPFFKDIDWDNLLSASPSFVPQPVGEEDTTYFDTRGATMQDQHSPTDNDDSNNLLLRTDRAEVEHAKSIILEQNPAKVNTIFGATDKEVAMDQEGTEFGTFMYKNLPLLEKANEDAIRKIRHDSIVINASSPSSPSSGDLPKVSGNDGMSASPTNWFHRSLPAISRKKRNSIFDLAPGNSSMNRPSASSSSSSLNHFACTTSLPTTPHNLSPSTSSKIMSTSPTPCMPITPPRNFNSGTSKGKSTLLKNSDSYGNSSSRLRSVSSPGNRLFNLSGSRITKSFADMMHSSHFSDQADLDGRKSSTKSDPYSTGKTSAPPSFYTDTIHPHQTRQKHNPMDAIPLSLSTFDFIDGHNSPVKPERRLACLLAEDNPISCKILETILERLNCRCVIARNGAQAIRYATGDVQFDLIFMDIRMPIIDGEAVARMIKSVKNPNQNTPIIAVTAYERTVKLADTFDDIVSKPVTKEMVEQRIRTFCHRSYLDSPPPGMTRPIMIPPPY